ncbi:hypothetical protein BC827DRAFT_1177415 [Russula dissimulans]|nr:hypothetical protein BC827DRAFT_1177415 [Russula dissimulans]
MCHWRRVTHTFIRCKHELQLDDEEIRCESRWCKFSLTHPTDCIAPQCQRTCNQFRSFPQHYKLQIDNWCQACWESGVARR